MKELRQARMNIAKAGGNASKEALGYKLTIPSSWAKKMGISLDSREVELEFNGKEIKVRKQTINEEKNSKSRT